MIDLNVTPKKMLIAVDALHDSALLELAASLARSQGAQLTALFIEDINLFHLAGLPFATEVDRVTSAELKFDVDRIGSASARRIKRIRQQLEELSKQSELTISLTVVRGHYLAEAMAASATMDLLLLDRPRGNRSLTIKKVSVKKFSPPVWAIYDGTEGSERALKLAIDIAISQKSGLNIILQRQSDNGIAEMEQQAKALLAGCNLASHFFIQSSRSYDSIMQYVLERGCSIVVLRADRSDPEASQSAASLFADRLGCPVLLVA
ncbi:MAG: hypothetical protein IBX56_05250 [Methylomicrobium sp.]|nr:hypothetical protein [Methylomicrobium sp.]